MYCDDVVCSNILLMKFIIGPVLCMFGNMSPTSNGTIFMLLKPEIFITCMVTGQFAAFDFTLHASKTALVSKTFQEYAFAEAMRLLLQHMSIYSYSPAFPEMIVPIVLQLKVCIVTAKYAGIIFFRLFWLPWFCCFCDTRGLTNIFIF